MFEAYLCDRIYIVSPCFTHKVAMKATRWNVNNLDVWFFNHEMTIRFKDLDPKLVWKKHEARSFGHFDAGTCDDAPVPEKLRQETALVIALCNKKTFAQQFWLGPEHWKSPSKAFEQVDNFQSRWLWTSATSQINLSHLPGGWGRCSLRYRRSILGVESYNDVLFVLFVLLMSC